MSIYGSGNISGGQTGRFGILGADTPSIDAFARFRVSEPSTIFDSKLLGDAAPLLWDDQEISGASTSSAHSSSRASVTLATAAATAGHRTRQTFMRFNYQPGKSQLVLMTFVLQKTAAEAGITRSVGMYDQDNGIFLRDNEGTIQFVIRSSATGTPVDTAIDQSEWNLDLFDGSGPSRVTLDLGKTHILAVDMEWLGVGRVRVGFVINGLIYHAHEFNHANILDVVYMSTPNLPLRYELDNDGTGASIAQLECICSSVVSEGGRDPNGLLRYKSTAGTHVDADVVGTIYACIGIRLKAAYLGATIDLVDMSMVSATNDNFEWILVLNPTVAGTFTYGDETNSSVQTATGATANTVTGGTYLAGGFASTSTLAVQSELRNAVRLGSAIDGTPDTMVLCVRPLSINADIQASLTWRELL